MPIPGIGGLAGLAGLGGTKVNVSSTTSSGVNSVINNIPGAGSNATSTPTQTQRQDASATALGDGGAALPSFGGSSPGREPSFNPAPVPGNGIMPIVLMMGALGAAGFVLFKAFSPGKKKKKGRK